MPGPGCHEPASQRGTSGAEDVVLHHRGEPGRAVLVGRQRRQTVTQVKQPPGLICAGIADVHPAVHRPPVELAAADVHAVLELAGQQVGDRGLASGLHADDEPEAGGHVPSRPNIGKHGSSPVIVTGTACVVCQVSRSSRKRRTVAACPRLTCRSMPSST